MNFLSKGFFFSREIQSIAVLTDDSISISFKRFLPWQHEYCVLSHDELVSLLTITSMTRARLLDRMPAEEFRPGDDAGFRHDSATIEG